MALRTSSFFLRSMPGSILGSRFLLDTMRALISATVRSKLRPSHAPDLDGSGLGELHRLEPDKLPLCVER